MADLWSELLWSWRRRRVRLALPVFTITIFLSALLLFAVQPMFTKMVLPRLGGASSVWSVALVFFQGLLLLGYLWSHLLTRFASLPVAAALHLCVCAIAFAAQPIAMANGWTPPADDGQSLWLVGLFAVSVGLPFFAVSANGPLLQAWFARSGHAHAQDPYFLYAASNLGSFAALFAYPFLIEPLMDLSSQSALWTSAFAVLAMAIAACAVLAASAAAGAPPAPGAAEDAAPIPREAPLAWIALAFVASGLLVSVTAHLSTDIASAPLLWILPLSAYLLTFVVAFRPLPPFADKAARLLHVCLAGVAMLLLTSPIALSLLVHVALFSVAAFVCHRSLYALRPPTSHLTTFYVCMSLGGVMGGIFAGLLAPTIFPKVYEYPLLIMASLVCQTGVWTALRTANPWRFAAPGSLAVGLVILVTAGLYLIRDLRVSTAGMIVVIAAMLLERERITRFLPSAVALVFIGAGLPPLLSQEMTYRSFFGVNKVRDSEDGRSRLLVHGTTVHGAMSLVDRDGKPAPHRPEPSTYYTFAGPLGEAIASVRGRKGALSHVAVVGLGVGALACHRREGEAFTFYEIDPLVARIAQDPALFRYLSACAPREPIVLGDARLRLAEQPRRSDVIVVDAFSSDSIPVHLITVEAIELYRARLAPDGVILFHISNRMMRLEGTLARVAAQAGLQMLVRTDVLSTAESVDGWTGSQVAALVVDPLHLGEAALASGAWTAEKPDMTAWPWTDEYSTILTPMLHRLFPNLRR